MRPVLIDTSVWRGFFKGHSGYLGLRDLLDEDGAVVVHPFVLGELVMGGLSQKEEELFNQLPVVALVPHDEVLGLVRRRRLVRRGIGWIDAHLLASALASTSVLWTSDKRLASAAGELKVNLATGTSYKSPQGF